MGFTTCYRDSFTFFFTCNITVASLPLSGAKRSLEMQVSRNKRKLNRGGLCMRFGSSDGGLLRCDAMYFSKKYKSYRGIFCVHLLGRSMKFQQTVKAFFASYSKKQLCLCLASCWFLACLTLWSWRWGRYVPLKVGGLLPNYTALQSRRSYSSLNLYSFLNAKDQVALPY
jgi:hypothetical protein